MSFCANCGRQRIGTAQFCDGCGTAFTEPPDAHGDQPPATQEAAPPGQPADEADPFASWYQPAAQGSDTGWEPTQTVQATPAQAAGYPRPAQPPGSPPPLFPPGPPGAPPGRGGRGLFVAVAVVVVLAAGGGAYALASSLGKQPSANPSAPSTGTAGTPPPTASTATSASTSLTPSPALSLVAVAPGVTASAVPQVETLLSHYFRGINTRNYPEYASTLNAAELAGQTQSKFEAGYSSTTDSGMTLTGLSGNGSGGLTATVTFTSHQSPAQSVDGRSCNTWTLNFYLVPQGNGYLIGPEPSGYQPIHADC